MSLHGPNEVQTDKLYLCAIKYYPKNYQYLDLYVPHLYCPLALPALTAQCHHIAICLSSKTDLLFIIVYYCCLSLESDLVEAVLVVTEVSVSECLLSLLSRGCWLFCSIECMEKSQKDIPSNAQACAKNVSMVPSRMAMSNLSLAEWPCHRQRP